MHWLFLHSKYKESLKKYKQLFKQKLFFICLIISSQFINAQRSVSSYTYGVDSVGGVSSYSFTQYGITVDELNSADGSPYLNKEFVHGTITIGDKEHPSYMRYNVFFDEIEISKMPDPEGYDGIGALRKDPLITATFNGKTFVYMQVGEGANKQGSYLQILSKGKQFDLYMKSSVSYRPPTYSTNGYDKPRPGRFDTTHLFFLVSKRNRFIPIPDKHRALLGMISYKKDELKQFLKKNRIKLDKIDDVKKFVAFYNAL